MKSEESVEHLNLTPASEIAVRTRRIQKALLEDGIEGMLVIQRVDLFYFSGTAQNAFLYIPADGNPLLMVKKYMPRACRESPIEAIVEIRSVKEIPQRIRDHYGRLPQSPRLRARRDARSGIPLLSGSFSAGRRVWMSPRSFTGSG